jgi:hypothetical protein
MGYKRLDLMSLYDIVRRWHGGSSISAIIRPLSKDRKTVRKYIRAAEQAGLSPDDPLPDRALPRVTHASPRSWPVVEGDFSKYASRMG